MNMKKVTLLIIVPFMLIAMFLNPSEYKFKDEVKEVYTNSREIAVDTFATSDFQSKKISFDNAMGNIIANNHINEKVNRDNYFVFSIAKWEDKYIGYGMFDNVYLTNEFKNKVESIE